MGGACQSKNGESKQQKSFTGLWPKCYNNEFLQRNQTTLLFFHSQNLFHFFEEELLFLLKGFTTFFESKPESVSKELIFR
jgi:hypothetical protein